MKLLCLSAIIMLNFTALYGQEYVAFPSENVNWNVYLVSSCNEEPPDTSLLRYTLKGDTVMNEVLYHKLCIESGELSNPDIRAIGGMREYEKKIYYRGEDILGGETAEERLLYDFTRQVGDTILHDTNGYFYSVVQDIDSMLIGC